MNYIETKIYTSRVGIEHVLNALSEIDIDDAVIEDPADVEELMEKKNSYDWDYVDSSVMEQINEEPAVILYIDQSDEGNEKLQAVKNAVERLKERMATGELGEKNSFGRMEITEEAVRDEDWKDNWKEFFKPAKITDRIVVKPTWEHYEKQEEDELIIEIDPGMAFGTGTHETTTLCIKLIEKYAKKEDALLDVGSGSGILSIAAALLGIERILGVDIDPVAVEVSKENVELNGFSDRIEIRQGDLTKGIDYMADLVVANLMADLVMVLSKDVAKHLNDKGIFISSGILIEKKEQVSEAIINSGFEILEILEQGEWCSIGARLK